MSTKALQAYKESKRQAETAARTGAGYIAEHSEPGFYERFQRVGNYVLVMAGVVVVGIGGYLGWQSHQAVQAGNLVDAVVEQVLREKTGNDKKTRTTVYAKFLTKLRKPGSSEYSETVNLEPQVAKVRSIDAAVVGAKKKGVRFKAYYHNNRLIANHPVSLYGIPALIALFGLGFALIVFRYRIL